MCQKVLEPPGKIVLHCFTQTDAGYRAASTTFVFPSVTFHAAPPLLCRLFKDPVPILVY
jgi:hypothetical protein